MSTDLIYRAIPSGRLVGCTCAFCASIDSAYDAPPRVEKVVAFLEVPLAHEGGPSVMDMRGLP